MHARYLILIAMFSLAPAAGASPTSAPALLEEAARLAVAEPSADTEQRLDDLVRALAQTLPDEASRALLSELASRPASIRVAHPEGSASLPLVDVGASARAVLRHWDRAQGRRKALDGLQKRHAGLVQQFFTSNDDVRAGLLDAIADSAQDELIVHRAAAFDRFSEPGGDQLLAAIGLRLADSSLLAKVLDAGTVPVAQQLLRLLDERFGAETRLRLFGAALQRPELASMALFRIAALPLREATERVWAALHEAQLGATAAAILARDAERGTVERLQRLRDTAADPLTRQRASLALSLSEARKTGTRPGARP